ncbi:MAG: pyridoxal phosphate-dependent aminotransferase [Ruminococcus sp.]|nr:pyridoxal phosphate-dependent aminotransferase [Ruminococcus sp.]
MPNDQNGVLFVRTFAKSTKLDHVCYDIRGPVMDAANEMIAAGEKILKLNIGNPAPFGFRTPDNILEAMKQNLVNAEGYSDSKGIEEAREAIISYHTSKGIEGIGINDIYTGNGVSELIVMVMQGLLNNGDEVLVPAPDYPLWTAAVTLSGGEAIHYICDERSEWNPDIEDMRSKITDKTKAIVLINPNNPTGAVYPKELLLQIADLAREHELIIFSDEIYDRLLMDGVEHTSIASLCPDLFCITFNGLSKSHMVAGYRCGWMVLSGDKSRVAGYIEGLNMLSSMRLCSNVQAQYIIKAALETPASADPLLKPGGRVYEQRECIWRAMNSIEGMSAVKPKAAFYIFPRIDAQRFNITNDEQFVLDLLREKKILLVHGGGFHWEQPDHFRIVYLPTVEVLSEASAKMAEFLADYRQK